MNATATQPPLTTVPLPKTAVQKLPSIPPPEQRLYQLPQTPRLKNALAFGNAYAREIGWEYASTDSLLIGIMDAECTVLDGALNNLGITPLQFREAVLSFMQPADHDGPRRYAEKLHGHKHPSSFI